MKKCATSLTLALCLLYFAPGVQSQSFIFKTYLEAADKSMAAAAFADAEKNYKACLIELETTQTAERLAIARKLSQAQAGQGKFKLARETLAQAVKARQEDSAAGPQTLLEKCLDGEALARSYRQEGNLTESLAAYGAVKDLLQGATLTSTLIGNYSSVLLGYAAVCQELGRYKDAESALKKNISLFEQANSLDTARALVAYAQLRSVEGRFSEGEALINKAIEIELALKADSAQLSSSYLGLARLFFAEEKMEKGEDALKKAYGQAVSAKSTSVLSDVLLLEVEHNQACGNFLRALEPAKQLLSLTEKQYGQKNPRVAAALAKLGDLEFNLKQFDPALDHYKKAIAVEEELFGKNGVEVARYLNDIGLVYLSLGRYEESRQVYERALTIVEANLGKDHPNVATCLNNLALLKLNSGQPGEAEALTLRGLEIRKKALGEKHPFVARNLVNLADVLLAEKKYDEGEERLKEALAIQEDVFGGEHTDTTQTMLNLAQYYLDRNKLDLSQQYLEKVLRADETAFGENSPPVLSDLEMMIKILRLSSRSKEASAYAIRSQKLRAALNGIGSGAQALPEMPVPQVNLAGSERSLAPRPVRDKWALVVGVSSFKDSSINLKYAAKDATDFRNYLINDAGFKPDHVKLLTNEQATRENIVAELGEKWLRNRASQDDMVVIYMSSHGSSARKEVSNANFILPYEGNINNVVLSGIPMQWFTQGVKDLVHSDRILLVLDVCHGGAVVNDGDMLAMANGGKSLGRRRENAVDFKNITVGEGQIVVASSLSGQLSWESENYPNSVFTRRLIEGLRLKGKSTGINEAFSYMRGKVEDEVLRDRGEMQTPIILTSGWSGGDLALACPVTNDVSTKSPIATQPAKKISGSAASKGTAKSAAKSASKSAPQKGK